MINNKTSRYAVKNTVWMYLEYNFKYLCKLYLNDALEYIILNVFKY